MSAAARGPVTITRSMSGGNQQKAIIAREIDKDPDLLVAVQSPVVLMSEPSNTFTAKLVAQRDKGKAVLLVSGTDEVMDVSDRDSCYVRRRAGLGQLDPKNRFCREELGLYMAGAKRIWFPKKYKREVRKA